MRAAKDLARELKVKGLMNIQFAVKDEQLYVIEVNPRASRTVPFVSKATGVSLAKLAAKVMLGHKLVDLGYTETIIPTHFSVKEAVFPWNRFPGIDIVLGPEMKSTGEVMGIDADWGMAYAKSQITAFNPLPTEGNVFLSVSDRDKDRAVAVARDLVRTRFQDLLHRRHPRTPHRRRHPMHPPLQARRAGPPERPRHDEEPRDPLRHQHPEQPRSPRRRSPDPLHRHRPENLPRHQPLRRRSLGESDALAQGEGTHGEEHPGVSRVSASFAWSMNISKMQQIDDAKDEVLETPFTREVFDATYPEGLDQDKVDDFHNGALKGRSSAVRGLLKAIERFPTVPSLKNYLAVAYTLRKQPEEAAATTEMTLKAHPDYLFGRVMAARLRIEKGRMEEALALLGPSLRLRDLYPETAFFHITEIKAYYHAVGIYHLAAGNREACAGTLIALQQLVPESAEVADLVHMIALHHSNDLRKRMEEDKRLAIRVREPEIPATGFPHDSPSFLNPEIHWLYDYGFDLPASKIRTILSLPRDSLVADLINLLEDAIRVGPATQWEMDAFGNDDEFNGPLNALHFLAEIRATEARDTVLEFFSQHSELLEMWLGEENFAEFLHPYVESSLERLTQWMKQPGLSAIAREGFAEAVAGLAMREPSRRAEVLAWFEDLLEFLAGSPPEDNILDTELVSTMVGSLCDLRAVELLPLIRKLYDRNLVSEFQVGGYDEIAEEFATPGDPRKIRPIRPLIDCYRARTTPQAPPEILRGGIESLMDRPTPKSQPDHIFAGRNDPCPCGSGRKFKKCCMK